MKPEELETVFECLDIAAEATMDGAAAIALARRIIALKFGKPEADDRPVKKPREKKPAVPESAPPVRPDATRNGGA